MAKNVSLLGANYLDVPSIILPQVGGGQAEFFADRATWLGANAELMKTFTRNYTFDDTSFSSWTPSSSAVSIKANEEVDVCSMDLAEYEYVVLWISDISIAYDSLEGLTKAPLKHVSVYCHHMFRRTKPIVASMEGSLLDGNATGYAGTHVIDYINQNGVETIEWGANQGFYTSQSTQNSTNSTSTNTSFRIKTPVLYAKAGNNYLDAATVPRIDSSESTVKYVCQIGRVKKGGFFNMASILAVDVFNNGTANL